MKKATQFVGLDVHAESIAVAVADSDGDVRSLGQIPATEDAVRRLVKKLGAPRDLRVCYEAGPCGYGLYWQLASLGVACDVVAPTLIPVRSGDRVKTDRRDAVKLARLHRSGELTAVWVPDKETEALRDIVRAREAAKKDQLRCRHRLSKFLLRQGRRYPEAKKWTGKFMDWAKAQRFDSGAQQAVLSDYVGEVERVAERITRLEQAIDDAVEQLPSTPKAVIAALQALRGVAKTTAATIVAEAGLLSRFPRPKQLMGYSGVVPREHSSGNRIQRGGITKTGNAHLRRVLVEAAWAYQHRPGISLKLRQRHQGLSEEVKAIAWKAQHRLHRRYCRLLAKGKPRPHVVTAVGRELLGFIWAIGTEAERQVRPESTRAAA
jgi:transposase